MLRRLLPREVGFFDFFEAHAALTVKGAREIRRMADEGANIKDIAKKIKDIEHEADKVTHACVEALHKTFITPIDRNDIHKLVSALDDIIDRIDRAARRLAIYDIEKVSDPVREAADVLVQATEAVERAVRGLRDMKNAKAILEECIHINQYENQGDTIHAEAMGRLFREERDPITLMKWREIYESLEDATDSCEDAANIIEGVVLEHG